MFPILQKKLKFDAVMSGNYIYIDQQEFIRICEERNIPGIILNKEGIGGSYMSDKISWYKTSCRFIGSKMLFLNEQYMNHDVKYLEGLDKSKACLVGQPRFDFYVNTPKKELKQIVLFAFNVKEYVSDWITDKNKNKIKAQQLYKNMLEKNKNELNYKKKKKSSL